MFSLLIELPIIFIWSFICQLIIFVEDSILTKNRRQGQMAQSVDRWV